MQRHAVFHLREVDLNEFRKIARQAGHFDVGNGVRNDALRNLDGRADFFAREVQRHAHRDFLIRHDALEVDVHDLRLVGMHLEGAQNNELLDAVKLHRQDRSVELFLAKGKEDRIVFELSGLVAAVDDARQLVRTTQTAARTRTLRLARGGDDFHW